MYGREVGFDTVWRSALTVVQVHLWYICALSGTQPADLRTGQPPIPPSLRRDRVKWNVISYYAINVLTFKIYHCCAKIRRQTHTYNDDECCCIVQAVDGDLPPMNTFRYVLLNSDYSMDFSVDSNTGLISAVSPLDYEALPTDYNGRLNLTVSAVDNSNPALNSNVSVTILLHVRSTVSFWSS